MLKISIRESEVYETLDDKQKRFAYNYNKSLLKEIYGQSAIYYHELENYKWFDTIFETEREFKDFLRNKRNRHARRRRASKKLDPIIEHFDGYTLIFGTCTFKDEEFITKTGKPKSERTRTKKVNEWIKKHFLYSIVNIDYGVKNEREHHHFIGVLSPDEEIEEVKSKSKKGYKMYELKNKDYKLGFEPTLEIVYNDENDPRHRKISNYLLKIKNHANKTTTHNRRFRIIK